MDFGNALNALRAGHKVGRPVWGAGLWIALERIGEDQREVIIENFGPGGSVQDSEGLKPEDLLAIDWEIVDG